MTHQIAPLIAVEQKSSRSRQLTLKPQNARIIIKFHCWGTLNESLALVLFYIM